MNRQSTRIPVCAATSSTQRDVIQANGHTGSQKNSMSYAVSSLVLMDRSTFVVVGYSAVSWGSEPRAARR